MNEMVEIHKKTAYKNIKNTDVLLIGMYYNTYIY